LFTSREVKSENTSNNTKILVIAESLIIYKAFRKSIDWIARNVHRLAAVPAFVAGQLKFVTKVQ
jgi:hypothetical protein